MQNMLLALTKNFSQKDVKVILIDPKQVDFVEFSNVPNVTHCTNQEEAIELLKNLVDEMESRYSKFKDCGAKKISQYRKKDISINDPMPFIWVFHDEFADWFMDEEYQEQVETYVNKLGVKARAAGIYLVFATQRPDKDVCPMQLRSNLGNRFILKVADSGTSELALGDKSLGNASELLGRGHMIAVTETFKGYCQVPYVSEEILDTWLN
jgi:S-DNA-T family DNA segregation ATPase FtsK/SpoIIIE